MLSNSVSIPYKNIPGFSPTTVHGHAGTLVAGQLDDQNILIMNGRFHAYEGHSMKQLGFPIQVMNRLGVNKLIITSASGGVNENYRPGDIIVIKDHLNLVRNHPIIGFENKDPHRCFDIYSSKLIDWVLSLGKELNIPLQSGIYTYMSGPQFETPAEVRMIRLLGGDLAGMSTVPEALIAAHLGIDIIGLSYVANLGAGMMDTTSLSHSEVLETMAKIQPMVLRLVKTILQNW
ncbi:UNVERIFIED_CONTAM: hypothetical protein GTU68_018929 [Idotea baltica]|nr:hypothetical protein [Idotea baltica]